MTVYVDLTREFNAGRLRAVICSGQACVLHRLAIASKDGDWILREDEEALAHVLGVLAKHGAHYRFGAPLDARWLSGGWSSHFEFHQDGLRVRTDFFTRPPRVSEDELARMWSEQEGRDIPFTDARILAEMKKTDRERDWAFVGEIARLLPEARDELLVSRSPRDLIRLATQHAKLTQSLVSRRPLLATLAQGSDRVLEELDREKRASMKADAQRLRGYLEAGRAWASAWLRLSRETESLGLLEAHRKIVERATSVLPPRPAGEGL